MEELKEILEKCIVKYGTLSPKTIHVSQQLDIKIVELQEKMLTEKSKRYKI